ncbi:MAG: hypothetical protein JWQ40_3645 [Segetibacter sp.]|nr:hypothetical protein [Segetibacter sp.]
MSGSLLVERHLILRSTNDNIAELLHKIVDYMHVKDYERTNK